MEFMCLRLCHQDQDPFTLMKNGNTSVPLIEILFQGGAYSGLRLTGRSVAFKLAEQQERRAASAIDISVQECISDRTGDWPAGGIQKAMTLFPCEIAT